MRLAPPLRRLVLRLSFSLLPLLLAAAVAEFVVRLSGYEGHPDREASWCREHAELNRPFFRPVPLGDNPTQAYGPAFSGHPRPFPVNKAGHERRVFVLGGSAAHGYGFSRNGSFSGRLEQLLGEAMPRLDVQVINAGTIAASSQQLLAMAKEILAELEPDLIIIYAGNNELLEWYDWRQYLPARAHRLFVASLRMNLLLSRSHAYLWLRDRLRGDGDARVWGQTSYSDDEALPWSERARLGDADRAWAREAFTHNLGRILDEAQAAGVPVVLSTVASNWMNQPGWIPDSDGSEPAPPPAAQQAKERAGALLATGVPEGGLPADTVRELEALAARACEAWSTAQCAYQWGTLFRDTYQPDQARLWLQEAIHRDEFPNRVKPFVNDATRSLAQRHQVPLVDGEAVLAALSPDGIIGYEQVYDHCHPTLQSHWHLAGELAKVIKRDVWPGQGMLDEADLDALVQAEVAELTGSVPEGDYLTDWLEVELDAGLGVYAADPESEGRERWFAARATAQARPEQPDAWNRLGVLAAHHFQADCRPDRGPCLDEAAEAFVTALELDPVLCAASTNLGWLRVQVGLTDEGLELLEQAASCEGPEGTAARLGARVRAWVKSP